MKRFKKEYLWLGLKYLIIALFFGVIIRGFILIPVPVTGNSMSPTLKQSDMVIMEKFTSVKRFDVVVFEQADQTTYIKRVIGLPGDQITYQDDILYVNNQAVSEPYLQKKNASKQMPYTTNFTLRELIGEDRLPEDQYFVLGDNRRISKDSRSFGTVKADEIIGKARFVYYPFSDMKIIS
ncbi:MULTISPECIES: signal peptidase I [Enterococcus]|uniref:Signal peptidase I n=1 Tax=Enterococcus alishanensis TaxID=1303817 RepID=A0ABS6TAU3_9ENTE|nr:signal peptidase I [Enterococcus alishanensis]MBV7390029.1 signal peptidase I [Enterococcus alishanensis]